MAAICPAASDACTTKLKSPAAVGVPPIRPVGDMVKPVGSDPLMTVNAYGGDPPTADSATVYGELTAPFGNGGTGEMVSPAGMIAIENAALARVPALSVACTVKLKVPGAVGVPPIRPVLLPRDRPLGSVPWVTRNVTGGTPPVTEMVCVYAVPALPPANDNVVSANGLAATAIENVCEAVAPAASAT